jgi:cytoskeletal protein RodZ
MPGGEEKIKLLRRFKQNKRLMILTIGLVAVILAAIAVLALTRGKKLDNSTGTVTPKGPQADSSQSASQGDNSQGSSQTGSNTSSSNNLPTDTSGQSAPLTAPSGQPNHTIASKSAPDQDEKSPNIEVNCLTLASATCVLQLTSPGGQVSSLSASSHDGQGGFIFNFSVKNYATGTWKMELMATKDGKSANTKLPNLQVEP